MVMPEVQIPIQDLPYGPYSTRLMEWSPNYNAVLTVERDSDTGFRYVVLYEETLGDVPGSLSEILGVAGSTLTQYLDDSVVQGHEPPGVNLISRWYFRCVVGASSYIVIPWQYLYRTVEDLGSVPGV